MSKPYRVYWNSGEWEEFATFAEALKFYRDLVKRRALMVQMVNLDRAGDFDCGLTEQEREELDVVWEEVA